MLAFRPSNTRPRARGRHSLHDAFDAGYETGEKAVSAAHVESPLSWHLDELEPALTCNGYRSKDLAEQFDAEPAEIKVLCRKCPRCAGAFSRKAASELVP